MNPYLQKPVTPYPSGSEEEALYFYEKLIEAWKRERSAPAKAASTEEVNEALMEATKATDPWEVAEATIDAVSLMFLGRRGDGFNLQKPRNSGAFSILLKENESFNDYQHMHLLYEELLERKEAGEHISHRDITRDQWIQLRHIEGLTNKPLEALFEVSQASLYQSQLRAEVGYDTTLRQDYQRYKTKRYKEKFPHLTRGHKTNYKKFGQ